MAGLDFFRRFTAGTERRRGGVRIQYAIQTNGVLLDEAWCAFLRENRFLVGLSLDVSPAFHDGCRTDPSGEGTFRRVMAAKAMLERAGVDYNVLTVLTNQLARHPKQVWNFVTREGIEYLQLIPCMAGLSDGERGVYALTPKRFASFYSQLFGLWAAEFRRGRYYSVKLFDDLINLLARGEQTACGLVGACAPQLVVEADGSVYPCDFYVLDEYRAGSLAERPLREIWSDPVMAAFRSRAHEGPRLCAECRFRPICGGGCKRMQREVCCAPDGASCGYQMFLDHCIGGLTAIAREQIGPERGTAGRA